MNDDKNVILIAACILYQDPGFAGTLKDAIKLVLEARDIIEQVRLGPKPKLEVKE